MFDNHSSNQPDPAPKGDLGGLIPINSTEPGKPTVNARDIHTVLKVGKDFSTWIQALIQKYDFKEGRDFTIDSPNLGNQKNGRGGDRRSLEYFLSLHMAKEIAMVTRGPKAKEVRKYFIACEEKLLEIMTRPAGLKLPQEMDEDERLDWEAGLVQRAQESRKAARMYKAGYHEQTNNLITVVVAGQAKDQVIQAQKEEIAELTPLAEAFKKLCDTDGLIPIGTMGIMLGVGPGIIFTYLYYHYILIEHGVRHKDPYGPFARKDYFVVKNVERTYIDKLGVLQKTTDKVTFATLKAADYVGRCLEITGIPDEKLKGRRPSKKLLLPLLP